jgi:hypothetical protein
VSQTLRNIFLFFRKRNTTGGDLDKPKEEQKRASRYCLLSSQVVVKPGFIDVC